MKQSLWGVNFWCHALFLCVIITIFLITAHADPTAPASTLIRSTYTLPNTNKAVSLTWPDRSPLGTMMNLTIDLYNINFDQPTESLIDLTVSSQWMTFLSDELHDTCWDEMGVARFRFINNVNTMSLYSLNVPTHTHIAHLTIHCPILTVNLRYPTEDATDNYVLLELDDSAFTTVLRFSQRSPTTGSSWVQTTPGPMNATIPQSSIQHVPGGGIEFTVLTTVAGPVSVVMQFDGITPTFLDDVVNDRKHSSFYTKKLLSNDFYGRNDGVTAQDMLMRRAVDARSESFLNAMYKDFDATTFSRPNGPNDKFLTTSSAYCYKISDVDILADPEALAAWEKTMVWDATWVHKYPRSGRLGALYPTAPTLTLQSQGSHICRFFTTAPLMGSLSLDLFSTRDRMVLYGLYDHFTSPKIDFGAQSLVVPKPSWHFKTINTQSFSLSYNLPLFAVGDLVVLEFLHNATLHTPPAMVVDQTTPPATADACIPFTVGWNKIAWVYRPTTQHSQGSRLFSMPQICHVALHELTAMLQATRVVMYVVPREHLPYTTHKGWQAITNTYASSSAVLKMDSTWLNAALLADHAVRILSSSLEYGDSLMISAGHTLADKLEIADTVVDLSPTDAQQNKARGEDFDNTNQLYGERPAGKRTITVSVTPMTIASSGYPRFDNAENIAYHRTFTDFDTTTGTNTPATAQNQAPAAPYRAQPLHLVFDLDDMGLSTHTTSLNTKTKQYDEYLRNAAEKNATINTYRDITCYYVRNGVPTRLTSAWGQSGVYTAVDEAFNNRLYVLLPPLAAGTPVNIRCELDLPMHSFLHNNPQIRYWLQSGTVVETLAVALFASRYPNEILHNDYAVLKYVQSKGLNRVAVPQNVNGVGNDLAKKVLKDKKRNTYSYISLINGAVTLFVDYPDSIIFSKQRSVVDQAQRSGLSEYVVPFADLTQFAPTNTHQVPAPLIPHPAVFDTATQQDVLFSNFATRNGTALVLYLAGGIDVDSTAVYDTILNNFIAALRNTRNFYGVVAAAQQDFDLLDIKLVSVTPMYNRDHEDVGVIPSRRFPTTATETADPYIALHAIDSATPSPFLLKPTRTQLVFTIAPLISPPPHDVSFASFTVADYDDVAQHYLTEYEAGRYDQPLEGLAYYKLHHTPGYYAECLYNPGAIPTLLCGGVCDMQCPDTIRCARNDDCVHGFCNNGICGGASATQYNYYNAALTPSIQHIAVMFTALVAILALI